MQIRSLIFWNYTPNSEKCISAHRNFQNFPGEHAPKPPRGARAASPRHDRYAITSFGVLESPPPPPPVTQILDPPLHSSHPNPFLIIVQSPHLYFNQRLKKHSPFSVGPFCVFAEAALAKGVQHTISSESWHAIVEIKQIGLALRPTQNMESCQLTQKISDSTCKLCYSQTQVTERHATTCSTCKCYNAHLQVIIRDNDRSLS